MEQPFFKSGQSILRWIIFLATSLLVNAPVGNAQINSEVTITSANFVTRSEDGGAITVMLTASNNIINGIVDVIYCGNLADNDFTTAPPAFVAFSGSTSEIITLTLYNDMIVEGTEAFDVILTGIRDLSMSQTLTIGTARHVRVEITDDDTEFIFLDGMAYVAETVGSVDVFVAGSKDVTAPIDITLEIRDLSAEDPSCIFPAGLVGMSTFMCPTMTIGDQYATCSVSFTAPGCFGLVLNNVDDTGASGTTAEIIGATSATTTVSIVAAGFGEISFAESFLFAREDAGTVDVIIVVPDPAAVVTNIPITVQAVAAGDVAATQFDDFTVDTFATLPVGGTRATATVTITDDNNLECLESIVLNLEAPGGETIVEPMSSTLYIEDDDAAATVSINTATITVNENDGCFNVGLASSAASECPYTGSYDLCGFTATPYEDIFASCVYQLPSASTSQQVRLCLNDDVLQEGTETLYLSVMPPSAFGTVMNGFAGITIVDNEATGGNVAALSIMGGGSSGTVQEDGTTTVELEVSVTTAFIGSVTLGYGAGDLTEPDDLTISTSTLLFDGSNTVATATVTAVDDTIAEYLSESLEIFIIDSDVPVDPASSTVTVTVTDDDIELSVYPTIVEAGEGGVINFVLVLDKAAPASAAATNILTATDISTDASDYSSLPSVDINTGDLFIGFQITIVADATAETIEVVEIIATAGTVTVTSTVTILDESDFGGKSVQLLASNNAATEGTMVMLSFILPGLGPYSLAFADATSDAVVGIDYSVTGSPISLPGATIDIFVIDDDEMEVNFENVLVAFIADDVYPQQTASVTIIDNEGPGDICCVRAINYVCEGDGIAVVEFEYKKFAPAGGINIDLAILYADGTAKQTIDFDSVTSSIYINAMAIFTATVSITQDIETEFDEEFYVYIEHNAYLNPTIATCTVIILDDDQENIDAPQCLNLPDDVFRVVELGASGIRVSWVEPTCSDSSGTAAIASQTHMPGDFFIVGETSVSYTCVNAAENTKTCSFLAVVQADVMSTNGIPCPRRAITIEPQGILTFVEWKTPIIHNTTRGETIVLKQDSPLGSGHHFPVGTTEVIYSADEALCRFWVIVNENEETIDVTPPTVYDCPEGPLKYNITSDQISFKPIWKEPFAIDDSGSPVVIQSSHSSGDPLEVGDTNVIFNFTDSADNLVQCIFVISVVETDELVPSPEILFCPTSIRYNLAAFADDVNITWSEPVIDNIISLNQTHSPGDSFKIGTTEVTYTAVNSAGKEAVCSFIVDIRDVMPPTVSLCSLGRSMRACRGTTTVVWLEPSAEDNSGFQVEQTQSHLPGASFFKEGTTTVNYTFSDTFGNAAVCSFNITVHRNSCQGFTREELNLYIYIALGLLIFVFAILTAINVCIYKNSRSTDDNDENNLSLHELTT